MTKGEQRFNAIKDDYIKNFKRTTGKTLESLSYLNGHVYLESPMRTHKFKIGEFETMAITIASRESFKPAKPVAKVAKLVYVTLVTRVIVGENDDEATIVDKARIGFQDKITRGELFENLDKIKKDKECPYGTFVTD